MRAVRRCEQTGSAGGDYRYLLEVDLGTPGPRLAVIGKNPSTASDQRSDATLGKIEAWAARHGFGSVCLVNLFAVRATRPEDLVGCPYDAAVGPENDRWLLDAIGRAETVVAAWGDPGPVDTQTYDRRASEVTALVGGDRLRIVGERTQKGYPRHGRLWNGNPSLGPWRSDDVAPSDSVVVGGVTVPWAEAESNVRRYLTDEGFFGYPYYDGFNAGTDDDHLGDGDLLAPALLNAGLSIRAFAGLQGRRTVLEGLLAEVPKDVDLTDATADDLRAVAALYSVLDHHGIPDVQGTTLAKVLHRKRPLLIPLYDSAIRQCYRDCPDAPVKRRPGRTWHQFMYELASTMQQDLRRDTAMWQQLRSLATRGPISPLRALDIVAWYAGRHSADHVVD